MNFDNMELNGIVDNLDFMPPPKNDPDDEPFISAPDTPVDELTNDDNDNSEENEDVKEFQNIGVSAYKDQADESDLVDEEETPEEISEETLKTESEKNNVQEEYYRQSKVTNVSRETPQDYYNSNYSSVPPDIHSSGQSIQDDQNLENIEAENESTESQGYNTGIPVDHNGYSPQIPPVAARYKEENTQAAYPNNNEQGKPKNLTASKIRGIFKSKICIKILLAAFLTCVMVLIILFMGKGITKKGDVAENKNINELSGKTTSKVNTDATNPDDILSEFIGQDSSIGSDFEDIYNNTDPSTTQITQESSRFANLDELTFYIESKTSSILADEKALYNQYNSGGIKYDDFKSNVQEYIDQVDGLNHLLVLNKKSYEEECELETYNRLLENISTLTAYGDTILYGN